MLGAAFYKLSHFFVNQSMAVSFFKTNKREMENKGTQETEENASKQVNDDKN